MRVGLHQSITIISSRGHNPGLHRLYEGLEISHRGPPPSYPPSSGETWLQVRCYPCPFRCGSHGGCHGTESPSMSSIEPHPGLCHRSHCPPLVSVRRSARYTLPWGKPHGRQPGSGQRTSPTWQGGANLPLSWPPTSTRYFTVPSRTVPLPCSGRGGGPPRPPLPPRGWIFPLGRV